ncbi:hypothetical protein Tco_1451949 [Tanacetum coccineum]
MHQTLSSGLKLSSCSSTCCGPDVCDIHTSYVSHQCTSSDGDNAAPYLPRELAGPCLLRGLAAPDLLVLAWWNLDLPMLFSSLSISNISLAKIETLNNPSLCKILHGVFYCALLAIWQWRNKVVNAPVASLS